MQKLFALVLVIALITSAAIQSSSKREDRLKAIQEKLADMSWSEYDPESFVAIQKAQAKIGLVNADNSSSNVLKPLFWSDASPSMLAPLTTW